MNQQEEDAQIYLLEETTNACSELDERETELRMLHNEVRTHSRINEEERVELEQTKNLISQEGSLCRE